MPSASLIIAASDNDSNLYYASRFLVPDPVIYFEINGKKHLVLSDLEIDRAFVEARVHHLLSLSRIRKEMTGKDAHGKHPPYALIVHHLFRKMKVTAITVPANFPSELYVSLKKLGFKITIKPDPFFESRLVKTEDEIRAIRRSLMKVENALTEAFKVLEKSKIKGDKIYFGRELVTSEMLRRIISTHLMTEGSIALSTIVASGVQGSYPHHEGRGPVRPHTPIIFDTYPRDQKSRYWGDMTRTVVKGRPSDEMKKMYRTVVGANRVGREMACAGITTDKIHQAVAGFMEKQGYQTGKINGRMQGFIHSTGHGLGLDIHELPSVSTAKWKLKKGNVITIEPGLYYQKIGGCRIEDVIAITRTGNKKLTHFPYFFEIDR